MLHRGHGRHRQAMDKAKLRVRRLTLAPHSDLCGDREDEDTNDEGNDQVKLHLDRERFAHTIELSVVAGEVNQKLSHRHGIERGFMSKF
jgi:hypothetical protein